MCVFLQKIDTSMSPPGLCRKPPHDLSINHLSHLLMEILHMEPSVARIHGASSRILNSGYRLLINWKNCTLFRSLLTIFIELSCLLSLFILLVLFLNYFIPLISEWEAATRGTRSLFCPHVWDAQRDAVLFLLPIEMCYFAVLRMRSGNWLSLGK